eukprot:TRINITY_DN6441_c0_g1_i1.p1 TRINITY_DN6441_c0_g1~~TRINITY_DN6441_c0_g1_i1.p1  ORF type:complete len:454 (-),score=107.27 TRINITY_DN6441_c0_g1_i1:22-1383(-)
MSSSSSASSDYVDQDIQNTHTVKRPKRSTRGSVVYDSDSDDQNTKKRAREESSGSSGEGPQRKKAKVVQPEAPFGLNWKREENVLILTSEEIEPSEKVAAFDMDDTLIKVASGRKFPTGRDDWEWWDPSVPAKLKSLHDDGFKIVILSNQNGIEKGKTKASDVCSKIIDLCEELDFPMQAFLALSNDNMRKPSPDLWYYFTDYFNGGIEAEKNPETFYCGDAAGRVEKVTKSEKKDFSCSDRKFALNIPVTFYTPETYFLGWDAEKQTYSLGFNPIEFLENCEVQTYDDSLLSQEREIIVNVGFPGSGKSSFTKKYLVPKDYVRVNKDELKSQKKCESVALESLEEGKSIVVDNTNPTIENRAVYIEMAKKFDCPIRCFYFDTPREIAEHLNVMRNLMSGGEIKRVPPIGYNIYNKNFVMPTVEEGFEEVKVIPFSPDFSGDEDLEAHFKHFT